MNDPSTPALSKNVSVPLIAPAPHFTVSGYMGGGYPAESVNGQAAQVYIVLMNALHGINEVIDQPISKWSSTDNLIVLPRAGRMLNAYYDRNTLSYFYDQDRILGYDIYSCDSHDIVAHELGHALLDSIRPDLWNTASVEVAAYHEAFADIIALISLLFDDDVVRYVLNETGGDLHMDNVASRIAEQFGLTVYHNTDSGNSGYLRNLNNNFRYDNPIVLPDTGVDSEIAAEPHSFSRIMSGTYYDVFVMMYEVELGRGIDPVNAVKNARNIFCRYLFRSLSRIALHTRFYQSAAYAMLEVDTYSNGMYQSAMNEIFKGRGIINGDQLVRTQSIMMLHRPNRNIRLRDVLPIRRKATNPLYDVNLEVPDDGIEGILAGHDFVQYIHKRSLASSHPHTPFQVLDGKLVRTHIACGCGGSGSFQNKFQPEYYRPYKPQNNAGCCGGCRNRDVKPEVKKPPVRMGCAITYRVSR
jgi:hypothetical protein